MKDEGEKAQGMLYSLVLKLKVFGYHHIDNSYLNERRIWTKNCLNLELRGNQFSFRLYSVSVQLELGFVLKCRR